MRRSELKRRTRLKNGPPPERRTPIRKRNRKRAEKRREAAFGTKADWIRGLPCVCCGLPAPSDPHHVISRGAGGDSRHLVPLSRICHTELHTVGRTTFERRRGLNLTDAAEKLHEQWRLEQ